MAARRRRAAADDGNESATAAACCCRSSARRCWCCSSRAATRRRCCSSADCSASRNTQCERALGVGRAALFRQASIESRSRSRCSAALGGVGLALGIVRVFKAIGGHAIPRLDAVTTGWPLLACGFGSATARGAARRARAGAARVAARSDRRAEERRRAQQRRPRRTPHAAGGDDDPDRVDARAARGRRTADSHAAQRGERAERLLDGPRPHDDGDGGSGQLVGLPPSRARARLARARRATGGVRLGHAADGERLAVDGRDRRLSGSETERPLRAAAALGHAPATSRCSVCRSSPAATFATRTSATRRRLPIVNQAFADRYFAGTAARSGRRSGWADAMHLDGDRRRRRDGRTGDLTQAPAPEIYSFAVAGVGVLQGSRRADGRRSRGQ